MKWPQKVSDLLRKIFCAKEHATINVLSYPSTFYRGVSSENDVDKGVYMKASAFQFGQNVPYYRDDGNKELSIVWNDCEEALETLLNQKNKKGTGPQFACGYATIKLSKFEDTVISYIASNMVGYERRPIEEDKDNGIEANPYHGNLLLHESVSEQLKKNIQHSLATISQFTKRLE